MDGQTLFGAGDMCGAPCMCGAPANFYLSPFFIESWRRRNTTHHHNITTTTTSVLYIHARQLPLTSLEWESHRPKFCRRDEIANPNPLVATYSIVSHDVNVTCTPSSVCCYLDYHGYYQPHPRLLRAGRVGPMKAAVVDGGGGGRFFESEK